MRSKVKEKSAAIAQQRNITGGGPPPAKVVKLTNIEAQFASLLLKATEISGTQQVELGLPQKLIVSAVTY